MKGFLLMVCVGAGLSCSAQDDDRLSQFEWLAGEWERTGMTPGREAYEVWALEGGQFTGKGVSMKGGDTTFVEKLSIQLLDGEYYYVADVPHNPEPTRFKIMEKDSGYFKASNPGHDFPKEIKYQLRDGELLAEISGDGQSIRFVFRKVR